MYMSSRGGAGHAQTTHRAAVNQYTELQVRNLQTKTTLHSRLVEACKRSAGTHYEGNRALSEYHSKRYLGRAPCMHAELRCSG